MAEFSVDRRLINLVDESSFGFLGLLALILTLFPAAAYSWFGQWQNGAYGYLGLPGPNGLDVDTDFWDALYFSVITETTLGYGDLVPKGWCRLIAAIQVSLGVILGGFAVAKVTSVQGAELRRFRKLVAGHWIETCTTNKGVKIVCFSTIGGTRLNTLRYRGDNYDLNGQFLGFFDGELLTASDDELTFTYSNKQSVTEHFEQGVSTHHCRLGPNGQYDYYEATAWDHAKNEKTKYEGFRALPSEIEAVRNGSPQERKTLIEKYGQKLR